MVRGKVIEKAFHSSVSFVEKNDLFEPRQNKPVESVATMNHNVGQERCGLVMKKRKNFPFFCFYSVEPRNHGDREKMVAVKSW
jgi:hypothetical protein